MTYVWVFLVLMNGHMAEVGGFNNETECENTRKEIIIQRTNLGYGLGYGKDPEKPYILTDYFESTKCFKVWKK